MWARLSQHGAPESGSLYACAMSALTTAKVHLRGGIAPPGPVPRRRR